MACFIHNEVSEIRVNNIYYPYCPVCYMWLPYIFCDCKSCSHKRDERGPNARSWVVLERLKK